MIDAIDLPTNEVQSAETHARRGILTLIVRWRWYWLPPLYGLALILLLIVTLTRGATTAQFMYNKF